MMDNGDDADAADGADDENVTRCYFRLCFSLLRQLSLLETYSILPQNQCFVCFPIVWKYVMREKICCTVCMRFISQKAEKW